MTSASLFSAAVLEVLISLTPCVCVCSRSRACAALPPPLSPSLSPLFGSLVNLLQCDVLLTVEGAVLQWAVEPSGGGWTESMLQRVRWVDRQTDKQTASGG